MRRKTGVYNEPTITEFLAESAELRWTGTLYLGDPVVELSPTPPHGPAPPTKSAQSWTAGSVRRGLARLLSGTNQCSALKYGRRGRAMRRYDHWQKQIPAWRYSCSSQVNIQVDLAAT